MKTLLGKLKFELSKKKKLQCSSQPKGISIFLHLIQLIDEESNAFFATDAWLRRKHVMSFKCKSRLLTVNYNEQNTLTSFW